MHEAREAAEIVPVGDAVKGDCNIDEDEANISVQIDTATQVQAKTAKAAAGHQYRGEQQAAAGHQHRAESGAATEGTIVDADTGKRPQAAPAESGKIRAEAAVKAAAADTMQPAAEQVQVCSVKFSQQSYKHAPVCCSL